MSDKTGPEEKVTVSFAMSHTFHIRELGRQYARVRESDPDSESQEPCKRLKIDGSVSQDSVAQESVAQDSVAQDSAPKDSVVQDSVPEDDSFSQDTVSDSATSDGKGGNAVMQSPPPSPPPNPPPRGDSPNHWRTIVDLETKEFGSVVGQSLQYPQTPVKGKSRQWIDTPETNEFHGDLVDEKLFSSQKAKEMMEIMKEGKDVMGKVLGEFEKVCQDLPRNYANNIVVAHTMHILPDLKDDWGAKDLKIPYNRYTPVMKIEGQRNALLKFMNKEQIAKFMACDEVSEELLLFMFNLPYEMMNGLEIMAADKAANKISASNFVRKIGKIWVDKQQNLMNPDSGRHFTVYRNLMSDFEPAMEKKPYFSVKEYNFWNYKDEMEPKVVYEYATNETVGSFRLIEVLKVEKLQKSSNHMIQEILKVEEVMEQKAAGLKDSEFLFCIYNPTIPLFIRLNRDNPFLLNAEGYMEDCKELEQFKDNVKCDEVNAAKEHLQAVLQQARCLEIDIDSLRIHPQALNHAIYFADSNLLLTFLQNLASGLHKLRADTVFDQSMGLGLSSLLSLAFNKDWRCQNPSLSEEKIFNIIHFFYFFIKHGCNEVGPELHDSMMVTLKSYMEQCNGYFGKFEVLENDTLWGLIEVRGLKAEDLLSNKDGCLKKFVHLLAIEINMVFKGAIDFEKEKVGICETMPGVSPTDSMPNEKHYRHWQNFQKEYDDRKLQSMENFCLDKEKKEEMQQYMKRINRLFWEVLVFIPVHDEVQMEEFIYLLVSANNFYQKWIQN